MALSMDEARTKIFEAIESAVPGAQPRALDGKTDLREALDIDSFDVLQIAVALKSLTGVDVPEADMGRLLTLDSAAEYLAARTAAP